MKLVLFFVALSCLSASAQIVDSTSTESVTNNMMLAQDTLPQPGAAVKSQQVNSSGQYDKFHFYLMPLVAIPAASFRKVIHNSIGNVGAGINIGALINPMKQPSVALLGIDFSYFNYGQRKSPGTATAPPLKTTFNVFTWNGTIRVQPFTRKLKWSPFADGMVGVKIYNTLTKIDKDVSNVVLNTNQREVINKVSNAGFNLGASGGFVRHGNDGTDFIVRVMYWWGDDITYVVPDSLMVDANGNVFYTTARAKTTMLVISLGINFSTLGGK